MELEKQRGISITSTVLSFEYNGNHINLLDTPGHQVQIVGYLSTDLLSRVNHVGKGPPFESRSTRTRFPT